MSYQTDPIGQQIIAGITGVSPTVVVTIAQWQFQILVLQGNATGTPVIQVPNGVASRIINNQIATGISVKTSGGAAAPIPASPSGNKLLWIDGANNANIIV